MSNREIVKSELRTGLTVSVGYYKTVADVDKDAKKEGFCLRLANTYMQQKSALPEANDFVVELIEKLTPAFPVNTEKNKTVDVKNKAGAVTGTKVINTETENEKVERFFAMVTAGTYVNETVGTDGKVWAQAQLDKHGPFNLDSSVPVRIGKPKTPSHFAKQAVEKIYAGGIKHIQAWLQRLAKEGFTVTGHTGKPEDLEADKLAMAWKVQARDDARRAATVDKEFGAVEPK